MLTVGWTLNFEMFFYGALACCMALSKRRFLAIFLVVFALVPIVYPAGAPLSAIARAPRLYEFWVGVALAVLWVEGLAKFVANHPKLSLAGALAFVLSGTGLLLAHGNMTVFALSIVAFALVCEQHLRHDAGLVRVLVHLGDTSYSTYLVHCIVIGMMLHFTGKNLAPLVQLATIAVTAIGTYAASLLSYRWIENSGHLRKAKLATVGLLDSKWDFLRADDASMETESDNQTVIR